MKKNLIGLVSFVLISLSTVIQAAATSGGLVLTQAVGARAQGMGEAFIGLADDATALYWNPSGLSNLSQVEVNAGYLIGFADTAYQQVMIGVPMGKKNGTLGLGLVLFQGGEVELDLAGGGFETVQAQSDMVLSAGYGYAVNKLIRLGASLKYYSSTLAEDATAVAFGGDLGLLLQFDKRLMVGIVLQNLGTEINYNEEADPMPLTAKAGLSYGFDIAAHHEVTIACDLLKPNDGDVRFHLGAEYWYSNMLALRVGYKTGYDLENLTAGLGFRLNPLQLDYALGLVHEFDMTHKISLAWRF